MNPLPIRLPFDIEVCGTELIEATNKGPYEFGFIAGVTPDLKWSNQEIINMFNITLSEQCPIREVKLVDIDSDNDINILFSNNIILNGIVNGTEDGLMIRNNVKVDSTFAFSVKVTTWGDVVAR